MNYNTNRSLYPMQPIKCSIPFHILLWKKRDRDRHRRTHQNRKTDTNHIKNILSLLLYLALASPTPSSFFFIFFSFLLKKSFHRLVKRLSFQLTEWELAGTISFQTHWNSKQRIVLFMNLRYWLHFFIHTSFIQRVFLPHQARVSIKTAPYALLQET